MRRQVLLGQNALHGGLDRPVQRRVSRGDRMTPYIRHQCLMSPDLCRQTKIHRFCARDGGAPSIGFRGDHRTLGTMVKILQSGLPSRVQGFVDALVEGGATHSYRSSNRLQWKAVCIGQKNAGSRRFPNWGRSGSATVWRLCRYSTVRIKGFLSVLSAIPTSKEKGW